MKSRPFLVALALSVAPIAHGQFYAPDTEYHDNAQRVFPVEAARVLGWVHNVGGAKIADVDYTVETTPERETVWTLRWRDSAGKVLREKTVRYPETALTSGPAFYRDVIQQLTADDWKPAIAAPDNAATAFWQGAEVAGVSRLEGLKAAGALLTDKPKMARPADCARMAGILVHSTLPRLGNTFTIDNVLLARGAAWLAIAEGLSREKYDTAWASVLGLCWREKAAAALWKEAPKKAPEKMSAAERFWNLLLSNPTAKDMYLFAARPENRAVAVPTLIYPSAISTDWTKMTMEVAPNILGSDVLERMHDYMPSLVIRGGVNGGHFGSEAPGQFLSSFERFIRDFQPGSLDDAPYRETLGKIPAAKGGEEEETSVLKRLAPVINLGLDQASGPLAPVAHITSRDLLGYGWEMTAVQFGYQYRFLAQSLGDPDAARQVARAALGSIKGIDPFFPSAKEPVLAALTDHARLQTIGAGVAHFTLEKNLPPTFSTEPDTYLRRTWMNRVGGEEALNHLVVAKGSDEVFKTNLKRLIDESGPLALQAILHGSKNDKYPPVINRVGLGQALVAAVPLATSLQRSAIWETTGRKGNFLGYAKALEKRCWDNCLALDEEHVLLGYLQGNAIESAKRFYDHIRPFVTETVGFSNTAGPQRFALAWWEKDDAGMKQAMRDSSTYSWSDLKLQTCYAAHSEKYDVAGKVLDAMIQRYGGSKVQDSRMKDYLALVPALKDPAHPDHAKAVDGFPQSVSWRLLQWILLKQANLNEEESVRFLGGDKAPADNRWMIAYVKRDKAALDKEYKANPWKFQNGEGALLALMHNELLEIKPPAEQPDLMPPGTKPLQQMIGDALNANTAAETKATLDFSKYKTADEFWAAVEKLSEQPRERANSPEDMMRRMRTWLTTKRTAAEAFLKAYPKDSHRHMAKLMVIDAGMGLARFGDGKAKPPERKELDEIIAAPDADATTKGEAEFFVVMLDSQSVSFHSPHTVPPFQQALNAYLEKYPKHPRAEYVGGLLLQLLTQVETPSTEPLLKKLAANTNEEIATPARAVLKRRQFMAELKKKPLDLKFTAIDGTEVDAAKLRGKVVLLDFWASWCGPCMSEAPNVVATYKKLHEKGFEIIGISLDEDKESMQAAIKRAGMTWPQQFDGKGWQTEIAQRFGVQSIPATWIFDKQGKLREHDLRGEELEARIEQLLKEK